jgi:hypothetical protein
MQHAKAAVPVMLITAALLTALGAQILGNPGPGQAPETAHPASPALPESGPLRTLLDQALADYGGRLLEWELEREHGRRILEIKLLDRDGKRQKLELAVPETP